MRKVSLLLTCLLSAVTVVQTQTVVTPEELHLKVTKILLTKDLEKFADELAATKPVGVDAVLLRFDVFQRLGQKERIRQTLVQLSEAADLPPVSARKWVLEIVRQKISRDLPALRIYYERITDDDGYYGTNPFIGLWQSEGNENDLDAWLSKRAVAGTSWFTINLDRRLRLGTVQPIFDELAGRFRQDPTDKNALNNYLQAVIRGQGYYRAKKQFPFENETNWLADIFPAKTAKEAYDLGVTFDEVNPLLAINYYRQSLDKPITPDEIKLLAQYGNILTSQTRIDWEKQLRYWTKEKLAAAYQRTEQATLAQPLMEELLVRSDDILSHKDYGLAGMVQAGSGVRAIESKVLQDEATRSTSFEYWYERIGYYNGRNEPEQVVKAFREGLGKIPGRDKARFIGWFEGYYRYSVRTRETELPLQKQRLEEILLDEFKAVSPDSDVAFSIAKAGSEDGFDLKGLQEALFIRRRDVLPKLVEKKAEWGGDESWLLRRVLKDNRLSPEQKQYYISELERIVSKGSLDLRMDLVEVMKETGEHARSIPLITYFLKHAPENPKDTWPRTYAWQCLFEAYIETGQWQTAEKLLAEQQAVFLPYWGIRLERLAICAGRHNARSDALRIWLKAVNFVGHSTFGLINLADTPAKTTIREYYRQMKQRDPNSPVPAAALKLLGER